MEIKYHTKDFKDELLKNFLFIDTEFIEKRSTFNDTEIYWIYKIINNKNAKVYIGKTKSIQSRALNYINAFLKGDLYSDLLIDMNKFGIENFTMKVIDITSSSKSASIRERYWIDVLDSIESGYNTSLNSPDYETRTYKRKNGIPHTTYSKIVKSKIICAVNPEDSTMIFSTGLKLFGDHIGRDKDEIKSFARRQTLVDGYFIYYMNSIDFEVQMMSAKTKVEKNSIYSDCNLKYKDFIEFGEYIKDFIHTGNNPKNMEIMFITQNSSSSSGYIYSNYMNILPQINI